MNSILEKNKKILVVDDEAHIRRVIELKLKNRGYWITTAKNGRDGLDIIQKYQPDVLITDINMPIMDGKTLCEKTDHLKRDRPFLTIILTARIVPEDKNWVRTMRDTLFLEKPFSPAKILKSIEQYFGAQR